MTDSKVKPPLRLDLHTAMGDPEGASVEFLPPEATLRQRLVDHEITLGDYWYLRGYGHYLQRDFAAAVEAFNVGLLHEPGRAEAHFHKGIALQLLGLAEAEGYPGFPAHVPARAHSLLLKARWAFQVVLDINPADEEARTYLQGLEALLR